MTYALPNPWITEPVAVIGIPIADDQRFELDAEHFLRVLVKFVTELQFQWEIAQLRRVA